MRAGAGVLDMLPAAAICAARLREIFDALAVKCLLQALDIQSKAPSWDGSWWRLTTLLTERWGVITATKF